MCKTKECRKRGTCNLGHVASEFAQVHHNDRVHGDVTRLRAEFSLTESATDFRDGIIRRHAEYVQRKSDEDLAQSMRNESEQELSPYHLPNVFKHKDNFDWYDFARAQAAAGHNIDPAIGHVQKKLFVPYRGHKSEREDIIECIKSLQNYLETLDD